jgi:alpha-beta hydrolase superfamily lysophospholipase
VTDNLLHVARPDGHAVAVHHWPAPAAPRAVLLIAHGMAEHGARYAPLAAFLNARGFHVLATNHRGHGSSAPRAEDLGHFADADGWQNVVDDLAAVIEAARQQHPGLPVILLGHSMGSFISLALARTPAAQALAALALSGSNRGDVLTFRVARLIARFECWRQGPRARSALLEFLSFGSFNRPFRPARTDYDWLSRDAAEVDKYVADPLCGFRVTNQLWVDLLGGLMTITRVQDLADIPHGLPVYILGGDRDPVGAQGKGLKHLADGLREAGLQRVQLQLYPQGRHEMFNETNRAEVYAQLADWLDRVLP